MLLLQAQAAEDALYEVGFMNGSLHGVTFQEPGFVRAQVMHATWRGSHVEYRLATR
jgi:hypothetical protein